MEGGSDGPDLDLDAYLSPASERGQPQVAYSAPRNPRSPTDRVRMFDAVREVVRGDESTAFVSVPTTMATSFNESGASTEPHLDCPVRVLLDLGEANGADLSFWELQPDHRDLDRVIGAYCAMRKKLEGGQIALGRQRQTR